MVDESREITSNEFNQEKNFITSMIRWLGVPSKDSRVGVLLYGGNSEVPIRFDSYKNIKNLNRAVDEFPYAPSGNRRVDRALARAAAVFTSRSSGERKVAVFLTGGRHVKEPGAREVETAAQWLHDAGVEVYVVGFNNRASMQSLRHVAKTDASIFRVPIVNELQSEVNLIAPHVASSAGSLTTIYP